MAIWFTSVYTIVVPLMFTQVVFNTRRKKKKSLLDFLFVLTCYILSGSGIRCVRARSPSLSEFSRFAGKWTELQHGRLRHILQGLFEKLPNRGVSRRLHFWQIRYTCSGQRLLQHPAAGRQAAAAAELHLAGRRKHDTRFTLTQ